MLKIHQIGYLTVLIDTDVYTITDGSEKDAAAGSVYHRIENVLPPLNDTMSELFK